MSTASQIVAPAPLYEQPLDPASVQASAELLLSKMDRFRLLPLAERRKRLARLTETERILLPTNWALIGRPTQQLPAGDWQTWAIIAGRGWGKTKTGIETTRTWIHQGVKLTHAIAPTAADINKVMLDGPAGFLASCAPGEISGVVRGNVNTITWYTGAKTLLFSAHEPERMRGPQCEKLWCDELAAWQYPQQALDMALYGLRLGTKPQNVITTTPKPIPALKAVLSQKHIDAGRTVVTRGSSFENKHNLAKAFLEQVIAPKLGTRQGLQEIYAQMLEDVPGALWTMLLLEELRVESLDRNTLRRVVVGVDPSATGNPESDECGIVVAAEGPETPPHYYTLADRSLQAHPDTWARAVVNAYHEFGADCIIAEKNNGGEMVEAVIRHVDRNVPIKLVTASRGKITRAEPIAALYEQKRAHHVGTFGVLESQMTEYCPATAEDSPDRMDALVWAMMDLSLRSWGLFELWREQTDAARNINSDRVDVLGRPLPARDPEDLKQLAAAQKKDTAFDSSWVGVLPGKEKVKVAVVLTCSNCGATGAQLRVYSEMYECCQCGNKALRPGAKPIPR